MPTEQLLQFVRWNDDDATTYDPLRMRITNLTQLYQPYPNPTSSQDKSDWIHFISR
jgi:hypothetical protein